MHHKIVIWKTQSSVWGLLTKTACWTVPKESPVFFWMERNVSEMQHLFFSSHVLMVSTDGSRAGPGWVPSCYWRRRSWSVRSRRRGRRRWTTRPGCLCSPRASWPTTMAEPRSLSSVYPRPLFTFQFTILLCLNNLTSHSSVRVFWFFLAHMLRIYNLHVYI